MGRFISRDPIFPLGGLNAYTYVGNNPVIFVDPFGFTENPINGPITSPFGPRINPVTGLPQGSHNGIDIGTGGQYGVPVGASDSGVVIQSGTTTTGEGRVTISQPNGMSQTYRDIDPSVSVGQFVPEMGTVGTTSPLGAQTAAHLHFETKIGGFPFDPTTYLPAKVSCP